MNLTETRKGELAILAESLINSLLPIVTLLSFSILKPLFSLAYSLALSALFFAFWVFLKNKFGELKNRQIIKDALGVALLIGVGYYGLYFWGLNYTSANNSGIILQMELFFSFLFFNVWKKESLTKAHLFGAGLMLLSTLLIFYPQMQKLDFNKGDLLILLCTALPPMGNFLQRKIRRQISGESLMLMRTAMSLPFIFLLAFIFHGFNLPAVNLSLLLFLIFNGVVILGVSKIFWLESILRISVTKANALASIRPFLTMLFSYLIIKELPQFWQLAAIAPMLCGVYFLTRPDKQTT